jgi:flagellar hook assembly protein FlgD
VNPFRAGAAPLVVRWSSPMRAPATLDVLDLQGRHVATLASGGIADGERTAHWDGRDERGDVAPPAMYLVRLRTPGATKVLRLVLVR